MRHCLLSLLAGFLKMWSKVDQNFHLETGPLVTKLVGELLQGYIQCLAQALALRTDLKVIFQSIHRIKYLFLHKGRLNRAQMSKVSYKTSCWDCQDFYIGKTKRRLHDRKTEHFRDGPLEKQWERGWGLVGKIHKKTDSCKGRWPKQEVKTKYSCRVNCTVGLTKCTCLKCTLYGSFQQLGKL